MHRPSSASLLVAVLWIATLAFGYFVWPTPYAYRMGEDAILYRINRFSGYTMWRNPLSDWSEGDAPGESEEDISDGHSSSNSTHSAPDSGSVDELFAPEE